MITIDDFKGNRYSEEERKYRLEKLQMEIDLEEVDVEIIPFLETINNFNIILTIQSCCGHDGVNNARAYLDFRSRLNAEHTVDMILKPLQKKYVHELYISFMGLEDDKLRYHLRLDNKIWRGQLGFLIAILNNIHFPEFFYSTAPEWFKMMEKYEG